MENLGSVTVFPRNLTPIGLRDWRQQRPSTSKLHYKPHMLSQNIKHRLEPSARVQLRVSRPARKYSAAWRYGSSLNVGVAASYKPTHTSCGQGLPPLLTTTRGERTSSGQAPSKNVWTRRHATRLRTIYTAVARVSWSTASRYQSCPDPPLAYTNQVRQRIP